MNSAEADAVRPIFKDVLLPVIVELGAHVGEDCAQFESFVEPHSSLFHLMVEPDSRNVIKLHQLLEVRFGNMRYIIRGAIAAKTEERVFWFSSEEGDIHGSGSILKPTGHLERIPRVSFPARGIVQCYSLDDLCCKMHIIPKIDLLWVDIQGAEREMIQGGQETLAKTRYCFMEAEDVELYDGQALKPELISLLPGWALVQDFGFNILLRNGRFSNVLL